MNANEIEVGNIIEVSVKVNVTGRGLTRAQQRAEREGAGVQAAKVLEIHPSKNGGYHFLVQEMLAAEPRWVAISEYRPVEISGTTPEVFDSCRSLIEKAAGLK